MPKEWLPYVPVVALAISLVALFISGANLGWNIFKELGLRARLRIRFGLKGIHHETFEQPITRFVFSVTNHGPGKVKIQMLYLRDARWWRRLLGKCRYAALLHDYKHALGGKLPYVLEVGEGMDLTFPIENSFVSDGYTHVGISDSFGRTHWCKKWEMKEALRAFQLETKKPN